MHNERAFWPACDAATLALVTALCLHVLALVRRDAVERRQRRTRAPHGRRAGRAARAAPDRPAARDARAERHAVTFSSCFFSASCFLLARSSSSGFGCSAVRCRVALYSAAR